MEAPTFRGPVAMRVPNLPDHNWKNFPRRRRRGSAMLGPGFGFKGVDRSGVETKSSKIGWKLEMGAQVVRKLAYITAIVLCAVLVVPAVAANLLTKATNLPTLMLSAGKPFPTAPMELEAGKYYRWTIESDGTNEMAVAAPDFFRFIWINEIVINKIEIRPLGLDSIEFDAKGAATISFVPIRPGTFEYFMPNAKGDAYRGKIVVK
jgi:hypothetical protein